MQAQNKRVDRVDILRILSSPVGVPQRHFFRELDKTEDQQKIGVKSKPDAQQNWIPVQDPNSSEPPIKTT